MEENRGMARQLSDELVEALTYVRLFRDLIPCSQVLEKVERSWPGHLKGTPCMVSG